MDSRKVKRYFSNNIIRWSTRCDDLLMHLEDIPQRPREKVDNAYVQSFSKLVTEMNDAQGVGSSMIKTMKKSQGDTSPLVHHQIRWTAMLFLQDACLIEYRTVDWDELVSKLNSRLKSHDFESLQGERERVLRFIQEGMPGVQDWQKGRLTNIELHRQTSKICHTIDGERKVVEFDGKAIQFEIVDAVFRGLTSHVRDQIPNYHRNKHAVNSAIEAIGLRIEKGSNDGFVADFKVLHENTF